MKIRTLFSILALSSSGINPSVGSDAPWRPTFDAVAPSGKVAHTEGGGCHRLPARLLAALEEAREYGNVLVRSTCGGAHARNSAHYSGEAVDFRVEGNCEGVYNRFKDWNGGFNRIATCLYHLDVRENRRW